MAAAATAAQLPVRHDRRPCLRAGGVTIGQLLTRAHEATQEGATAGCPMCGGAMSARGPEARCDDCGTRLS